MERSMRLYAHEVRGVLGGRQTQFRRVVKLKEGQWIDGNQIAYDRVDRRGTSWNETKPCPYGAGDRLWVREAFAIQQHLNLQLSTPQPVHYLADITDRAEIEDYTGKPSIHMPRWASRITLEVKAARVERLQQISEADAIAEGIQRNSFTPQEWIDYPEGTSLAGWNDPRHSFRSLWYSINGRESWHANPWVWVVEFERMVP